MWALSEGEETVFNGGEACADASEAEDDRRRQQKAGPSKRRKRRVVDSDEEEEEDNNNNNNNKSVEGRLGTTKELLRKLAEDVSELRAEMRDLQDEVKWGMDRLQQRLMLVVTGVREPTKWQNLPLARDLERGLGEQDREWTPGSTSSEEEKTLEEASEESSEETEEE